MIAHRLTQLLRLSILICSGALFSACSTLSPPQLPYPFNGDYTPVTEYLSAIIHDEMKSADLMGLSIALIDKQNLVWSEGFGYANKDKKLRATSNTRYRAGSVSKLFNAVAVMQLYEQNRLELDKAVDNYVADFSINSRFGSTDTITLRSLLSHDSGIPSDILDGMWKVDPPPIDSLLGELRDSYMVTPTGTLFSYSNAGVSLSGLAVQSVSGMPYESYLQQSVLKPLRMNDSNFSGRLQGDTAATGYINNKQIDELPLRDTPAGGLNTTVNDLARFVMAIHAGGAPLLSETSLTHMLEVQNAGREIDLGRRVGLGWMYESELFAEHYETIWHDGRTIAHSARLAIVPELGLGVVVLSNSADDSGALKRIADKALQQLYATRKPIQQGPPVNKAKATGIVSSSDLSGDYAGPFGLISIAPDGERFHAEALGMTLSLRPEKDNWFSPRVKLGFITLRPKDLRPLTVTQSKIGGKTRLLGAYEAERFILGDRIEHYPAENIWDKRLGHYSIRTPMEVDQFGAREVHFKRGSSFYYLEMESPDNMLVKMPVRPLNDSQFVVLGTGRALGDTVAMLPESERPAFRLFGLEYELVE